LDFIKAIFIFLSLYGVGMDDAVSQVALLLSQFSDLQIDVKTARFVHVYLT